MDPYNKKVATHYVAYRPPIHQMILQKVLSSDDTFSTGVDVGCGTGYSTLALADYCSQVFGIDPSESMLERAFKHQHVRYMRGTGEKIPLSKQTIDITTFAGSLFYTDIDRVSSEIQRVSADHAIILAYDFNVHLTEFYSMFGLDELSEDENYNHSVNFTGMPGFVEDLDGQEEVHIECTGEQLAHLLLSDLQHLKAFSIKFQTENPFEPVKNNLIQGGNHYFPAVSLYYSKYHLQK